MNRIITVFTLGALAVVASGCGAAAPASAESPGPTPAPAATPATAATPAATTAATTAATPAATTPAATNPKSPSKTPGRIQERGFETDSACKTPTGATSSSPPVCDGECEWSAEQALCVPKNSGVIVHERGGGVR